MWLPVLAYAAVIFGLSTIPGNKVPQISTLAYFDKFEHAVLYSLFGTLAAWALSVLRPRLGPASCVLLVAYGALLYGTSDEVHQLFTPGRACDPFDTLADLTGGTLGAVGFTLLSHLTRSRRGGRTAVQ